MEVLRILNGVVTNTGEPTTTEGARFVICCPHGDWSGYLTWAEALRRMESLARNLAPKRPDGYFYLEER